MSSNTTASSNFTTGGQTVVTTVTTVPSEQQDNEDTITLIVTLIIALVVLLMGIGGTIYCFLQKRKKTKSCDVQRGSIIGHDGGEENIDSWRSRESGAYMSYDAINVDILKEIHTEKRSDLPTELTAIDRTSKESNVSGAYRSFDNLENILSDLHIPSYESNIYLNRVSNYDFEVPLEASDDIASVHNGKQSFHGTFNHRRKQKMRSSELVQHNHREIDNPLFSNMTQYE